MDVNSRSGLEHIASLYRQTEAANSSNKIDAGAEKLTRAVSETNVLPPSTHKRVKIPKVSSQQVQSAQTEETQKTDQPETTKKVVIRVRTVVRVIKSKNPEQPPVNDPISSAISSPQHTSPAATSAKPDMAPQQTLSADKIIQMLGEEPTIPSSSLFTNGLTFDSFVASLTEDQKEKLDNSLQIRSLQSPVDMPMTTAELELKTPVGEIEKEEKPTQGQAITNTPPPQYKSTLESLKSAVSSLSNENTKLRVAEDGSFLVKKRSVFSEVFGTLFTGRSEKSQKAATKLVHDLNTVLKEAVAQNDEKTIREVGSLLKQLDSSVWFNSVCQKNSSLYTELRSEKKAFTNLLLKDLNTTQTSFEEALESKDEKAMSSSFERIQQIKSDSVLASKESSQEICNTVRELESQFVTAAAQDGKLLSILIGDPANPDDTGKLNALSQAGRQQLFKLAENHPQKKDIEAQLTTTNLKDLIIGHCGNESLLATLTKAEDYAFGTNNWAPLKQSFESLPVGFFSLTRDLDTVTSALQSVAKDSKFQASEQLQSLVTSFVTAFNASDLLTSSAREMLAEPPLSTLSNTPVAKEKPTPSHLQNGALSLTKASEEMSKEDLVNTLAEDLQTYTTHHFQAINAGIFGVKDFSKEASLQKMTAILNNFSGYIASDIVNQKDLNSAQNQVHFWLEVAEKCLEKGNLHIANAINSALNNAGVYRLLFDKSEPPNTIMDATHQKIYNRLTSLFKTEANSKAIRTHIQRLIKEGKPYIPFLGTLQTDLTFLKDGNTAKGIIQPKISQTLASSYDQFLAIPQRRGALQQSTPLTLDLEQLTSSSFDDKEIYRTSTTKHKSASIPAEFASQYEGIKAEKQAPILTKESAQSKPLTLFERAEYQASLATVPLARAFFHKNVEVRNEVKKFAKILSKGFTNPQVQARARMQAKMAMYHAVQKALLQNKDKDLSETQFKRAILQECIQSLMRFDAPIENKIEVLKNLPDQALKVSESQMRHYQEIGKKYAEALLPTLSETIKEAHPHLADELAFTLAVGHILIKSDSLGFESYEMRKGAELLPQELQEPLITYINKGDPLKRIDDNRLNIRQGFWKNTP